MQTITLEKGVPGDGHVLLYIGTDWCKYCKFTRPAAEKAEAARDDLTAYAVDGDEDPEALLHYGATTYPTLILFKDGVEVARRPSAREDELSAWLDEHMAKA